MGRALHATVWGVGLGSSVFFSAGWVFFIWHLTDAFRHLTATGWIAFLRPRSTGPGGPGALCTLTHQR